MSGPLQDYGYADSAPTHAHGYLVPTLLELLRVRVPSGSRVFELGCGSGYVASVMAGAGYAVTGIDAAESGIAQARRAYAGIRFEVDRVESDLAGRYGEFPCVVSLEVIEHCYSPRLFAQRVRELLEPGGVAILSTPYHGYWKNLALALTGRLDRHWDPLWEGGHIKFFSIRTLRAVLEGAGLRDPRFMRVGRWPRALAKSMFAVISR